MVFINGILATQEDKDLLSYRILKENLGFSAIKDEFGNQFVETFD